MIQLTDEKNLPQLFEFCQEGPTACQIYSSAKAYGTGTGFAEFWLQRDEEKIVGAYARIDTSLFFCGQPVSQALQEERESFCRMVYGARTLFYAENDRKRLPTGEKVQTGQIFIKKPTENFLYKKREFPEPLRMTSLSDCRELFLFLAESGEPAVQVGKSDAAYVDFSHRVRHGLLSAWELRESATNRLVACALVTATNRTTAVISGVYCLPAWRKKGLASALLEKICERQAPAHRSTAVFAYPGAEQFYHKNGFVEDGYWVEERLY